MIAQVNFIYFASSIILAFVVTGYIKQAIFHFQWHENGGKPARFSWRAIPLIFGQVFKEWFIVSTVGGILYFLFTLLGRL
jgi:hypothetical protein